MTLPIIKLDHCPRDPGCTCRTVWKDPDTGKLYTMRVKNRTNRDEEYTTELVPHVCTTKTVGPPTTFFASEWYNTRTTFTRYVGPSRLMRSVFTPPVDKPGGRADWEFKTLLTVENVQWKEIPIPEEFEVVPFTVKDRK